MRNNFVHNLVTKILEPNPVPKLPLQMKTSKSFWTIPGKTLLAAFLLVAGSLAQASTVWDGPTNGFYHAVSGASDEITTNVIITRGGSGGLYNSFLESGATGGVSPKGTLWAQGTLANTNLSYAACPMEAHGSPSQYIGHTFVVHLLTNDIYLQLTLTNWLGEGGSGDTTFGYTRSSPTVPPSISSPTNGTVLSAPANVTIQASVAAHVPVPFTNMQFYANNTLLGSSSTAPYSFTANNLSAGSYSITAVEIEAGNSTTSAVVNITVSGPASQPSVTITNPASGAVFSAPANLTVGATASDTGGTITGVQFFLVAGGNATVISNVTASPYVAFTNGVGAGSYTLTAITTDNNSITSTNSIPISVVTPVSVALGSSATVASTNFEFRYAANVGLSYVVQVSTNLISGNWVSLATNVATSNPVIFVDPHATNGAGYYRVGLLPNP